MRFFKPDLSSLGGVFKAPKLGPRHDKMAAHVSESPTAVFLPKGYDDIVYVFFTLLCIVAFEAPIFCFLEIFTHLGWIASSYFAKVLLFLFYCM